ncbi:hypothetical protein [Pararhodobacter sp.]
MRDIHALGLPAGESVQHAACAARQPHVLLMLPACLLGVLPGVGLSALLTKHYVVGVSRNFLIVARLDRRWQREAVPADAVTSCDAIGLGSLRSVPKSVRRSALFTQIRFGKGRDAFRARFGRGLSKANRAEAEAIGEVITAQVERRQRARD